MHKAYIPESLVGKVNDREAYLISAIHWQQSLKQVKRSGHVPLKLVYLREIMGHRSAGLTIKRLIDRGLVNADRNWVGGAVSRGYRLDKAYIGQRLVGVPFEDPVLDARILSWELRRIKMAIDGRPERQWLFDNLSTLDFRNGITGVIAKHSDSINKLNMRIQAVGRIEDKRWWFAVDQASGRVFHNAATLPKDCRAMLLIDGQPAAETDIANCQPFMLASMYSGPSEERTRYMDLCVSGQFYEHLNGLLDEPVANRDDLKVAVYRNIMYGTAFHNDKPAFKAFSRAWPILGAAVAAMKYGKGGSSRLPVLMQSAEAEIVLGRVVPRLMLEMPESRALTVHDSLLLPARYATDAAAIMTEEITKRFGVAPPVRVKWPVLKRPDSKP